MAGTQSGAGAGAGSSKGAGAPYDLIVKNGLVIDGSGEEPRVEDVAVKDGRIVESSNRMENSPFSPERAGGAGLASVAAAEASVMASTYPLAPGASRRSGRAGPATDRFHVGREADPLYLVG